MDSLKLIGSIVLSGILVWLRLSSPETIRRRLENRLEKKKVRRDELLTKNPHDFSDATELAGVINDISKLLTKISNIK